MRLGVGQCVGELALITGLPRTATALANEPTVLLELKRDNFMQIMDKYQNIRFHIMGLVEHRLEETQRIDTEITKRAASPYRFRSAGSSTSNLLDSTCTVHWAHVSRRLLTLLLLFPPLSVCSKRQVTERRVAEQVTRRKPGRRTRARYAVPQAHVVLAFINTARPLMSSKCAWVCIG